MRRIYILCFFGLIAAGGLKSQDAINGLTLRFPGFDTTTLDNYAANPDYQYTQSTPEESLLDRWWTAFKNMLRDLFFGGQNTWQGILYIVLIGGVAILFIYFLGKSRFSGAFSSRDRDMRSGRILETELPDTPLDILAAQAFQSGDFRLAYRWRYLDLLKKLHATGALRLHPEKTNRDYKRDLRRHPQSAGFAILANTFDRIWYGGYPMDASTYAERQRLIDLILAENPSI